MIREILEKLTAILGAIATLSKERRELKDMALRTVCNALDETCLYFRDRERGLVRNIDREDLLVKYWSAAAIPLRHFDEELAIICVRKSEYWLNPDNYDEQQIEVLGIGLESVKQAYKAHLKYSFRVVR